ncbi:hypothetical protein F2Q69_00002293 [Brassica cretica]|uniref:Uncharacterized protein n=1 Tax=Brassica cretica TaxID=69181 RepID=A0A8S9P817_BRACR|nr:hypothetical protein F2Q69_00002293 [Brassica cretica]
MQSADGVDQQSTSAVHPLPIPWTAFTCGRRLRPIHANLKLSGPNPRTGVVHGFRPRDGPSQEQFRSLVQSDLVVRGLVHLLAFANFLHACPSNSPNFNLRFSKPQILHMHMLCT